MNTLYVSDIKKIFTEIASLLEENKDFLCDLDSKLGDGDLGITMNKGFQAIKENLPNLSEEDIGLIFMRSGAEMSEEAASTMGTLVASALISGGKAIKGKTVLTSEDFYELIAAMKEGIMKRGKANIGDKTIIDVIDPAVTAAKLAIENQKSLSETVIDAYQAAERGLQETTEMMARHGRAARYLEKSIGHQDPGATAGKLILQGFANYVSKSN